MSQPNIAAAATALYKEGTVTTLTSGLVTITANASGSGATIEVRSIVLTNQNETATVKGIVKKQNAAGSVKFLGGSVSIQAGGIVPIRDSANSVILLEGESILATGSTSIDIEVNQERFQG